MVVTIEQLGLTDLQERATRLRMRGMKLEEIGEKLNGIKKNAVSQLLSRAQAKAAAAGVNLFSRQRHIRPRSLSGCWGV